jgi:hypothetical protein
MKVKRAFSVGYGEELPPLAAVCTNDRQNAVGSPFHGCLQAF